MVRGKQRTVGFQRAVPQGPTGRGSVAGRAPGWRPPQGVHVGRLADARQTSSMWRTILPKAFDFEWLQFSRVKLSPDISFDWQMCALACSCKGSGGVCVPLLPGAYSNEAG